MTEPRDLPGPATQRASAFTQGVQVGVDAHAIERELADLWRHSSETDTASDAYGHEQSHGAAAIRACAWNLIVLAEPDRIEAIRETVDRLSHAVPTRTLLVSASASPAADAAPVTASVTARCQVSPSGGKLLCSEEITLEAAPSGGRHVAAIARALLVPDVPTALYVAAGKDLFASGGEGLLATALAGLVGSLDRILFDSSVVSTNDLRRALAGSFKEIELADFAWLRDGYLRSALASMFDPPTGAEPLARLASISVAHAGGLVRARLVAAFVAAQLKWKVTPAGTRRADGGQVSVRLSVAPEAGKGGKTPAVHVELATTQGETFTLTDLGGGTMVQCDSEACRRTQLVSAPTDEALLRAALSARGRDPLYRRALASSDFGAEAER